MMMTNSHFDGFRVWDCMLGCGKLSGLMIKFPIYLRREFVYGWWLEAFHITPRFEPMFYYSSVFVTTQLFSVLKQKTVPIVFWKRIYLYFHPNLEFEYTNIILD